MKPVPGARHVAVQVRSGGLRAVEESKGCRRCVGSSSGDGEIHKAVPGALSWPANERGEICARDVQRIEL